MVHVHGLGSVATLCYSVSSSSSSKKLQPYSEMAELTQEVRHIII